MSGYIYMDTEECVLEQWSCGFTAVQRLQSHVVGCKEKREGEKRERDREREGEKRERDREKCRSGRKRKVKSLSKDT